MAPQRGEGIGFQQREITLMKQMMRRIRKAFISMEQKAITREEVSLLVRKRTMAKILK